MNNLGERVKENRLYSIHLINLFVLLTTGYDACVINEILKRQFL